MNLRSAIYPLVHRGLYLVHLGCVLHATWIETLNQEGFQAQQHDQLAGRTTLLLTAEDQAQMVGFMAYLHGLGIPLVSVTYIGDAPEPA
jgi:hypothetical protein